MTECLAGVDAQGWCGCAELSGSAVVALTVLRGDGSWLGDAFASVNVLGWCWPITREPVNQYVAQGWTKSMRTQSCRWRTISRARLKWDME